MCSSDLAWADAAALAGIGQVLRWHAGAVGQLDGLAGAVARDGSRWAAAAAGRAGVPGQARAGAGALVGVGQVLARIAQALTLMAHFCRLLAGAVAAAVQRIGAVQARIARALTVDAALAGCAGAVAAALLIVARVVRRNARLTTHAQGPGAHRAPAAAVGRIAGVLCRAAAVALAADLPYQTRAVAAAIGETRRRLAPAGSGFDACRNHKARQQRGSGHADLTTTLRRGTVSGSTAACQSGAA